MIFLRKGIRNIIFSSRFTTTCLLRLFLRLNEYSRSKISTLAKHLNNGIHPKHGIMNYHKFFVDRISQTDIVLDIGCGIGILTYDISKKAKKVLAIDNNEKRISIAKLQYQSDNIEYICDDITGNIPDKMFDAIVLSNVLEHLPERVEILKELRKHLDDGGKFLIRVPCLDRDWIVLYKKEVGLSYMLDSTHYIEYTSETFENEIKAAALSIISSERIFGEIWAVCIKVK